MEARVMEEFYWLTVPNSSDISNIEIEPSNRKSERVNLKDCIWFEDSEREEATQFLKELRNYMRELYCSKYGHQDRAEWMTEKWVETGNKLLDR